jgi:hypothetical protein
MPEILKLLAPLFLGSINRENLPKRVRRKGTTLIAAGRKLFQEIGAVSLVCHGDSREMLMFPLLMADQIMHPSNGMLTALAKQGILSSSLYQKWRLPFLFHFQVFGPQGAQALFKLLRTYD